MLEEAGMQEDFSIRKRLRDWKEEHDGVEVIYVF